MKISDLKQSFLEDIKNVKDIKNLEDIKIKYLGRERGELTNILRSLKDLSMEEKRKIGPKANALRNEIEEALKEKLGELKATSDKRQVCIDISHPGIKPSIGHLNPLTLIEDEVKDIFSSLNFSVVEGPEIETEYYNFDALNIPKDHLARDGWNTFWLKTPNSQINADDTQINADKRRRISANLRSNLRESALLRTHTSPMQIRYMEKHKPPFQIIVPGRVFRYEAIDASHQINFYQVEGLMVGEDISLANFKFIIETFLKKLFGNAIDFRYRPSYFPFVEPGLEVDIKINQKSNIKNQNSDWMEIMGAGMVHPNVFKAVGYNPNKVQGFAFGVGLERLAMIKYEIPDIRLFYSGDMRFIHQF